MKYNELIFNLKNEYQIEYYSAKTLLKYVFNIDDNYLISHNNDEVDKNKIDQVLKYANDIKNGKPLQYITHKQNFFGNEFYVDENVLIPQPDTEIVVKCAIEKINECSNKKQVKVLDLCTGSGAIGITIKKYCKENVDITLSDISENALKIAKKNATNILKNNMQNIKFIQSDMFENINEKFDIIVSNPPYIETDEIKNLEKDVQNEPNIALDGGKDGLKFYKIIKSNVNSHLNKCGYVILEIGYNQKESVQKIFPKSICLKDYAGNDRVIIFKQEE